MPQDKNRIDYEKNKLDKTIVSAGKNVHIGDVYNLPDSELEKEKEKSIGNSPWRLTLFRFLGLALVSVTLIGLNIKQCTLINFGEEITEPVKKTENETSTENSQENESTNLHVKKDTVKRNDPVPGAIPKEKPAVQMEGHVYDEKTGAPLEGVLISMGKNNSTTSINGFFSLTIKDVPKVGGIKLRYYKQGYESENHRYYEVPKKDIEEKLQKLN